MQETKTRAEQEAAEIEKAAAEQAAAEQAKAEAERQKKKVPVALVVAIVFIPAFAGYESSCKVMALHEDLCYD